MARLKLEAGQDVLGYTAGKMRRFRIKIFSGDRVKIELSPYDLTKGRSFIASSGRLRSVAPALSPLRRC
jgi:translation initiation factor IF-1